MPQDQVVTHKPEFVIAGLTRSGTPYQPSVY